MRWLVRIAGGILLAAAVTAGADELSFLFNFPSRPPFASVHVEHYKVVTEKFNLTSWDRITPEEKRCVNSLLPHSGALPCWYVQRHRVEVQKIN